MATITTRAGKGSALTFTEMDTNFTNLNTDKLETSGGTVTGNISFAAGKTVTIGNEYTFPTTDGTANQFLKTDGNGNLSFAAGSGGIALTDLSVGAEGTASGDGSLAYNNTTGVFTYTPPLLSGLSGDSDDISEGSTNQYYTDAKARAVSIENVSEDTTPELGGTLDILTHDIKSSTANVVISADANDKDIELKIKDTGGTLQQAAHFNTENRNEHTTPGGATEAAIYEPVLDVPHGIRIGSNNFKFSDDGATPDNDDNYSTTGLIITNGDRNLWPQVDIVNFGGANPLYYRFGVPSHAKFPNAALAFKAANGTETTPAAIENGNRIGGVYFNVHDGTAFGGSSARASGSIEGNAIEDASSSNDRAIKITFNVMPAGGDGTASSRDTVIDAREEYVEIGNITDSKYIKVDKANEELLLNDIRLDLGSVGRIRAATDTDIRLDPQGTGIVRIDTAVRLDNQSGDPSGSTDASHIYAKDVSSSSEVFVRDEAGNVTQISPHNEQGEWQYFSRNIKTGKTVRVNMEKMIRKLEEFTGETFIENE